MHCNDEQSVKSFIFFSPSSRSNTMSFKQVLNGEIMRIFSDELSLMKCL